jgi:ferredoxin
MPKLTIIGHGTYEVPAGTRLVRAVMDSGADILHRCGGWAKCTTCRVDIIDGRPAVMTRAAFERLTANGQLGEFDLSCQTLVEDDMTVRPLMRLTGSDLDDAGPKPDETITPAAEWVARPGDDDAPNTNAAPVPNPDAL